MRKILIIGIGAGNPDYITVQAINALNQVDVFFIPDKGLEKAALRLLRQDLCERYITDADYRMVRVPMPVRASGGASYERNVGEWHAELASTFGALINTELGEDQCGGFLVWGDPTLYDSTLRIVRYLQDNGYALDVDVIPGISSAQALAARHRVAINRIGQPVLITTGRRLAEGFPNNIDSVVVMLDGEFVAKDMEISDHDIYWGAYVGTEEEVLVSGKLSEVVNDIETIRARKRRENGWIMDTYIIKSRTVD